MIKKTLAKVGSEPIGFAALIVTISIAAFQSSWFDRIVSGEVVLKAHYASEEENRCVLSAIQLDNNSSYIHGDLEIYLVEDWITKSGEEAVNFGTSSQMLITSEIKTNIEYREEMSIEYVSEGGLIKIPKLSQGQYLDFYFAREISSRMNHARKSLGEDDRYWNTPRVEYVGSDRGPIRIQNFGDCLNRSS